MTTILYVGLGYWLLCGIMAFGSMFLCPEAKNDREFAQLQTFPSPWREMAYAVGGLVVLLIAPVFVPWMLIQAFVEDHHERAAMLALLRSHRENVYERIHPVNLPKIARAHFDERAPEMLAIGFAMLGDYVLKPEPCISYGRCFHSADGRTVGVLNQILDSTAFSFTTLFSNGLVLETTPIESTPELAAINESAQYRAVFCPDMSIDAVYDRHRQAIADLESSMDIRAMAFRPDQFRDVLTYEGRVCNLMLYKMGKKDAPPPAAILPPEADNFESLAAEEADSFVDAHAETPTAEIS